MNSYHIVTHPSGKLRVIKNSNGVVSFVNDAKSKYFKTLEDAASFIKKLQAKNQHKLRIKKQNPRVIVNL